jgi:hypothetical protein
VRLASTAEEAAPNHNPSFKEPVFPLWAWEDATSGKRGVTWSVETAAERAGVQAAVADEVAWGTSGQGLAGTRGSRRRSVVVPAPLFAVRQTKPAVALLVSVRRVEMPPPVSVSALLLSSEACRLPPTPPLTCFRCAPPCLRAGHTAHANNPGPPVSGALAATAGTMLLRRRRRRRWTFWGSAQGRKSTTTAGSLAARWFPGGGCRVGRRSWGGGYRAGPWRRPTDGPTERAPQALRTGEAPGGAARWTRTGRTSPGPRGCRAGAGGRRRGGSTATAGCSCRACSSSARRTSGCARRPPPRGAGACGAAVTTRAAQPRSVARLRFRSCHESTSARRTAARCAVDRLRL